MSMKATGRICLAAVLSLFVAAAFARAGLCEGPTQVALTLEGKELSAVGVLTEGVTAVALDPLAQELGLAVSRTPGEGAVTIVKGNCQVKMFLELSVAETNGHEVAVPFKPRETAGALMIPLRFVLENLGYDVLWQDGKELRVDIVPFKANDLHLGNVREKLQTETLTVDAQYPRILGLDPEIQEAMNAYFRERAKRAVDQGLLSEDQSAKADPVRWPTQVFLNYRVTYNRGGLLSILFDDYLYTGGAHGGTVREGYIVDIERGKRLGLADMFTPGTDYVSLLSRNIGEQIRAEGTEPLSPFERIREDQDFYVEKEALVIYFQQYELMAYAYGFPEFRIPWGELSEVLSPELTSLWR